MPNKDIIDQAYTAFNDRDIDGVLSLLHENVRWANGWEGGFVHGHKEVRDYWTRQWQQINPRVKPLEVRVRPDKRYEVLVHQIVKDLNGVTIFNGMAKHIFTLEQGLVTQFDIETPL